MEKRNKHITMMIKVIKDCQRHKEMGTPNRVWSTYFRYALNELEKNSTLISCKAKQNPNQKTIHEHTVPFKILRDKLMSLEEIDFESVSNILSKFHVVTKITYAEDKQLKDAGLNLKMPKDWDGKNPFARYEAVGITVFQDMRDQR